MQQHFLVATEKPCGSVLSSLDLVCLGLSTCRLFEFILHITSLVCCREKNSSDTEDTCFRCFFRPWITRPLSVVRGTGTPSGDRAGLCALFAETGGSSWRRSYFWSTDRPLTLWPGVYVDDYSRVAKLRLWNNSLTGMVWPWPLVLAFACFGPKARNICADSVLVA